MIKIGLAGAGTAGVIHGYCYEFLKEKEDFVVAAVGDIHPVRARKLAQRLGAGVNTSALEMVRLRDFNAIDICLPTYLHLTYAQYAMEKGCDIIMETPLCLGDQDAHKLIDMREKARVKVMVAQSSRFRPEYVYLKKTIDEKKYGKLVSGEFKRFSPVPVWGWEDWIVDRKKSGAAVFDLHIHDVDFVRYIMGVPDDIKCEVTADYEHISSLFRYKDFNISLEGGWQRTEGSPFQMEYRIVFEKATIIYNSAVNSSVRVLMNGKDEIEHGNELCINMELENAGLNLTGNVEYLNEIKYFLECINGNKQIERASLEEAIQSMELLKKELEVALIK